MKNLTRTLYPASRIAGFALSLALGAALHAQDPRPSGQSTGTIAGRVVNAASGDYLEKVQLTIEGTALETFTDLDGFYRFDSVPAGTVRLRAFYTGQEPQTEVVAVGAGQVVQRDFNLSAVVGVTPKGAAGDVVAMSEYVVAVSREMGATALAINEQRFAPNIKNVLSTDEFGGVSEGNVVEFVKFMPGVNVDYNGGNARTVYINGVPSANVPVTIDGFGLASTESGGTARDVALDFVSINNASFVEVSFSPTPDSQGSALAGSVNLVPRSSFGRTHPVYQGSVYLMMRDNDRHFNRTPGPLKGSSRKVHPGFDFSAIVPVNKRFGFTVSAGSSTQYSAQPMASATWQGVGAATNGNAYPDTTFDKPYLTQYLVRDGSKTTTRNSFGFTVDYKFAAYDRLSLSYQVSTFAMLGINRSLTFTVGRVAPGQFSTSYVHGSAGQGTLEIGCDSGADRLNRTHMPTLVWRHEGPIWKMEGGLGYSQATNAIRGSDKGFINVLVARRTGVTVSFDDIGYVRPGTITVTDAAGAPVDPYSLSNYALISANNQKRDPVDVQRTAYANVRRDFFWRVPFTLKGGLDLRQSMRDVPGNYNAPYSYVGRDGRASTTPVGSDDSAAPFLDVEYSSRTAPWGFPRIQWVSPELVWEGIKANPAQFVLNENNEYRNPTGNSKWAQETISAAFLRGDVSLLERRLKLIGGLRAEQTNVKAQGPLTDLSRNILRDAQGRPILGANGQPLPITTDALQTSKLTYLPRGTHTEKEYLRYFPSLNASYNVRENLIARASYYYSVGRPNFNQYAGGAQLPNTDNPPSPSNRITVTGNAGIKAWTAKSTSLRLEYYFSNVGQISLGAFRRDFTNFFGSTVTKATPEFLELYSIDPTTYGAYDVSTSYNLPGVVRMEGLEFAYKQALTFLPFWARGVQVFTNANTLRATGPNVDNFTGIALIPRTYNWGVSLTRAKYSLRMNWNYRGRQREGLGTMGRSIDPRTYNWTAMRYSYDLLGEYKISRRLSAFATLRNINDAPLQREIAGPSTPAVAYLDQLVEYGALWTFGIKGSF